MNYFLLFVQGLVVATVISGAMALYWRIKVMGPDKSRD